MPNKSYVCYNVETETGVFYFYDGKHTEEEITMFNHKISDFIKELVANAPKSG